MFRPNWFGFRSYSKNDFKWVFKKTRFQTFPLWFFVRSLLLIAPTCALKLFLVYTCRYGRSTQILRTDIASVSMLQCLFTKFHITHPPVEWRCPKRNFSIKNSYLQPIVIVLKNNIRVGARKIKRQPIPWWDTRKFHILSR